LPISIVSLDAIRAPQRSVVGTKVPTASSSTASADRLGIPLSFPGVEPTLGGENLPRRSPAVRAAMQVARTTVPIVAVDFVMLGAAVGATDLVVSVMSRGSVHLPVAAIVLASIVIYSTLALPLGLFRVAGANPVAELRHGIQACGITSVIAPVLVRPSGLSGLWWIASIGTLLLLTLIGLPLARIIARSVFSRFSWWGVAAVIIGNGHQAEVMRRFFTDATNRGIRPTTVLNSLSTFSVIDQQGRTTYKHPTFAERETADKTIHSLESLHRAHAFPLAIVTSQDVSDSTMADLIARVQSIVRDVIVPVGGQLPSLWCDAGDMAGFIGIRCRDRLRRPLPQCLKRLTDFTLSSALIVALSPLILLVAVLIKFFSPGPVFYGHVRVGRGGRAFRAWKFRSMVMDADRRLQDVLAEDPALRIQWNENQKLRRDPRVIPTIGAFLRKTSLDELPQLWNVLLGQMSLVGPRPIVSSEITKYRADYSLYQQVRPGITGLWQVSGRNDTTYAQRVSLDSYYVRNWSYWLDVYLLLRTIRTTALREGAY